MEKALQEMSASVLRNLLIDEVKRFVDGLDKAPENELDMQKHRLRMIYELIAEKEKAERAPLQWGKNAAQKAALLSPGPDTGLDLGHTTN